MLTFLAILLYILILAFFVGPRYRHPRIARKVVTEEECEYIKKSALPKLAPSTLGDECDVDYKQRQSESTFLELSDPKIRDIALRFVKEEDLEKCEHLQVVRYKPGGFYDPHQDADYKHTNKRKYTVIIYLNDDYEGGYTDFPVLDRSYRLVKCDALMFDTLDTWDRITPQALHGGTPVISGEKWICNLWVREFKYHP